MLVVHHTHEDVDQYFGVGSRYLYKGIKFVLSPSEWKTAMNTAYADLNAEHEDIKTVNDWDAFFGLTKATASSRVGHVLHGIGSTRTTKDGDPGGRCPKAFWVCR